MDRATGTGLRCRDRPVHRRTVGPMAILCINPNAQERAQYMRRPTPAWSCSGFSRPGCFWSVAARDEHFPGKANGQKLAKSIARCAGLRFIMGSSAASSPASNLGGSASLRTVVGCS